MNKDYELILLAAGLESAWGTSENKSFSALLETP